MNTVCLSGRLTRDVELRKTNSGKSVISFTVANDVGFGDKKKTNFINCVAWEGTADTISTYFKKGDGIIISGELSQRSYETNDGKKQSTVELLVRAFDFMLKNSNTEPQSTGFTPIEEEAEGDLPF